jgi:hypothetical protein
MLCKLNDENKGVMRTLIEEIRLLLWPKVQVKPSEAPAGRQDKA